MQVNENTVTIKKSPRSTFNHNHTHKGSGRIGDLNVVWHKMLMPSDMIRCNVETSIQFISPLSVPAFARMKVYTYYFFEPYQNVQTDFNDMIMNYLHENKTEILNGKVVYQSNYRAASISLWQFQEYMQSFYYKRFYDVFNHGGAGTQLKTVLETQHPDKADFVYASYEQRVNIEHLCSQMGYPKSILLLPDNEEITYYSFDWNGITGSFDFTANSAKDFFENHQAFPYYCNFPNYTSDFPGVALMFGAANYLALNILPFKCYQAIYNDWFMNTITNSPIDIFPDTVSYNLNICDLTQGNNTSSKFALPATEVTDGGGQGVKFGAIEELHVFDYDANYYMNSVFQIRQPWYSKDYFNTASPDPTLGVSPYSVGSSILDLRKNSALQRLAEKKALCGNKFVDFIVQHFNIYPPDLEIERSIHLGTSVSYVSVQEVLQTSQTTNQSPQGERAAVARSHSRSKGVFFKAPTYGEFMVLQCVKPEIDYFNGIRRELTVVDAADYPLPELSQIGMDKIYKYELVASGSRQSNSVLTDAFGYAPRYSWQKFSLNQVSGRLAYDLEFWHQSPDLRLSAPNLDYTFGQIGFDAFYNTGFAVQSRDEFQSPYLPAYNRVFAVQDFNEDTFVYIHDINATINTTLPVNDMPQL